MLIGAYGKFWERDLVSWEERGWRMLGRRGSNSGTLEIADFRRARGVYVLYSDTGIYYVGLAGGQQGIGGRLYNHLQDDHYHAWKRFSWFAFDGPSRTERYPDGVHKHEAWSSVEELQDAVAIREMEALLIAATDPPGNVQRTKFMDGEEWTQLPDRNQELLTFDKLQGRLGATDQR